MAWVVRGCDTRARALNCADLAPPFPRVSFCKIPIRWISSRAARVDCVSTGLKSRRHIKQSAKSVKKVKKMLVSA